MKDRGAVSSQLGARPQLLQVFALEMLEEVLGTWVVCEVPAHGDVHKCPELSAIENRNKDENARII